MKKLAIALVAAVTMMSSGCTPDAKTEAGKRAEALDNSAWEVSEWIAATDAPVNNEIIGGAAERAADGASWFVSTVKNDKKIVRSEERRVGKECGS